MLPEGTCARYVADRGSSGSIVGAWICGGGSLDGSPSPFFITRVCGGTSRKWRYRGMIPQNLRMTTPRIPPFRLGEKT